MPLIDMVLVDMDYRKDYSINYIRIGGCFFFFNFMPSPRGHVALPRPETESEPQQQPTLQLWQHWIL